MKFYIEYELEGISIGKIFYGESAGEAFAKCLLKYPKSKLIRCIKRGEDGTGQPDPKMGETIWEPTPVQRQPEQPPPPLPKRAIPKYMETPDPMPAMRDWYEAQKSKQ